MQATGNNNPKNMLQARITIRASKNALSFSVAEGERQVTYEPYAMKSGVSMAANLRQAFKDSDLLLRGYRKARLFIDAPILLVPIDEFDEKEKEALYHYSFDEHESDIIMHRVQPQLNAVALFPLNKDLKMVMEDNFADVRFTPILQPVWNHLHQRNFVGLQKKLYAYFHDNKLEIFCFDKNRFKFFNSYATTHAKDAIYFILYVWKQLCMDQKKDELHVVGDVPDKDWFMHNIKLYIQRAYLLNPAAEFNRAPLTEIKNIPFDLLALYLSR